MDRAARRQDVFNSSTGRAGARFSTTMPLPKFVDKDGEADHA